MIEKEKERKKERKSFELVSTKTEINAPRLELLS